MDRQDYIDATCELFARRQEVNAFIVGYTAGLLSPEQRAKVIFEARRIYGAPEQSS